MLSESQILYLPLLFQNFYSLTRMKSEVCIHEFSAKADAQGTLDIPAPGSLLPTKHIL